ncbi:MAG: hypothetical protein A2731_03815 [Candidatus Buchananbacteria bacterium RIFCSPHIGHO2_01_FULL_39_8]|uniref:Uncharacterized protein n=1 Tax=Candidatus Buchananbacteria bacterium RIFCSPHIGHO2_01_FULL_39_8 TaxID=1797533 RepID=A0A1G1XTV9_9BACT|nr:MAG: hypothetical protein A2731_03815 [Candidatus Buchananbacteria bacterium RIFCSPHIGHO2_01_FULL_39_8]
MKTPDGVAKPTQDATFSTHSVVQTIKCPNCSQELHSARKTVTITCRCGKTYKVQPSIRQSEQALQRKAV